MSERAGLATVVFAALFAAATAYTFALSLSESFNPPNWLRVLGLVWLPIGLAGAAVSYTVARTGPGRTAGRLGLLVLLLSVVAFVVLLFAKG